MSSSNRSADDRLRFFATEPHPCSYLPGEEATTLYLDPMAPVDRALHTRLSAVGFRRSGNHLYRPYCADCQACIPVRVPAATFRARRGQRRVWRRNQDLQVTAVEAAYSDERFALYAEYLATRHADGDMYPPREDQFRSFLVEGPGTTSFYEFRRERQLLCVAVADRLDDALSAVYTFFAPGESARGLGVYAVLWLLAEAQRLGLSHLYLGYFIADCAKMNYKLDYRPAEVLLEGGWTRVA